MENKRTDLLLRDLLGNFDPLSIKKERELEKENAESEREEFFLHEDAIISDWEKEQYFITL